jgi:hypothetical protein
VTSLEDKMWAERQQLWQEAREVRDLLGLDRTATHEELLGHLGDLRRRLAEASALNESFRAELDAAYAEQAHDPAQVSLFTEADPAQQRRPRLALVPVDDPPLEQAGEAIAAAVEAVPGVEHIAVNSVPEPPNTFMVVVRGGSDQDIARALLRTFPQRTVQFAGNTKVEVGDDAVWLCRPNPPKASE